MIEIIILIITSLLFLMVLITIIESIVKKQSIVGRPTIPLPFFIMAKIFPFTNITFLLLKGLKIEMEVVVNLPVIFDYVALVFLFTGLILAEITSFKLKKDLIFGLSDSKSHKLQTNGIYSISRHPFYLGFLLILCSSVLFVPNIFNIVIFIFSWLLHHFIMIKEEEFLTSKYGDEYIQYSRKVRRYITLIRN